ncbi:MAG: 16S rRNA (guanine(527)-N(7))-methyltransferase RsmG [Solirubrobacterales bacterium]
MSDQTRFLELLAERYGFDAATIQRLQRLTEWSVSLEISGTAVRDVSGALRIHLADSLSGLDLQAIRDARTLVDIGAGVGFPGLALAVARPELQVTLVDSVRKKMEAAATLARELALPNVECIWSRVEDYSAVGSEARESFDVVTARALAALPILVEYAAPLARVGGSLVAWKGDPDPVERADADAATELIGFERGELVATKPFRGSARRHFYVATKRSPCPDGYPRRPGAALRKPLRA